MKRSKRFKRRAVVECLEERRLLAAPSRNSRYLPAQLGNKIGRITPAGQVTEFPVSSSPGDIKAGPDGDLWFTETKPGPPSPGRRDMIGRITPSGQVTEFPMRGFLMSGEAFGPDGNLWFTQGVYEPITGGPIGFKRAEFLTRITAAGQITEMPLFGFVGGDELIFGAMETSGTPRTSTPSASPITVQSRLLTSCSQKTNCQR